MTYLINKHAGYSFYVAGMFEGLPCLVLCMAKDFWTNQRPYEINSSKATNVWTNQRPYEINSQKTKHFWTNQRPYEIISQKAKNVWKNQRPYEIYSWKLSANKQESITGSGQRFSRRRRFKGHT